jgi:DNA mismatch repair ATPase MutS
MKGHLPEYTYRLEQGITDDRHGMIIIRNEGILDVLKEGRKKDAGHTRAESFITDKQTIEELNLLGKFRQGSVYGLFNRVKTRGGEQLLESMFRQPLENATAINERSAIFRFFQQSALSFPFDVQQITLMREYLDGTAPKNAVLALAGTLLEKGLSALARDERYKKNMQGLQATITTLHKCYGFVESFGQKAGPYSKRLDEVRQILANRHLEKLRQVDIYKAISVRTLAYYNHLLRSRLYREMETLLSFFYEVDLNIVVSDAARGKGFSYAQAQPAEKDLFSAVGIYHPCLDKAVGNTLTLTRDSNVLFLTGANMAGKSTLMKSVGIGIYLAHMGFPVAATEMTFSVRGGLYSSINVADNIGLGYSHFYAEVVRVKQAAEAAASGKKLVLMFDELFKGTNVKDAYDGTLAVTEAFADYRDCLFIVSTHIIEVGAALAGLHNIQFAYMPTVMEGARPRYSYRMQEGVTEDRQGMMIIKNEGILALLNNIK